MIQEIEPQKLYNQYSERRDPAPEDKVMHFHGRQMLAQKTKTGISFLSVSQWNPCPELRYLLHVDETAYFLAVDQEIPVPEGCDYYDLNRLRDAEGMDVQHGFPAYTAKHLADWYRDNRFCGRCGATMIHSETERAMTCPSCHYTSYPRIMPAVIVGVKNGDSLLLTRNRERNFHALIAGFTEIGETLEETVAREVMEEAGIRVKNIRYYKSQPWGLANDILVGFFCQVDGDDTLAVDTNELSGAEWVKREDIILQPSTYSMTGEMMKRFKDGIEK